MIEEIYIRDLGVIQEARLPFKSGLTVLTGETGAGKTMVLTALGLLLGERSDSSAIRRGQGEAYVEGRWFVPNSAAIANKVEEVGANPADGELILNRTVSAEGRSRASLLGRAVPVNVLAELSEHLVVVHGQADQLRLKSAVAQREALDKFGGAAIAAALAEYADEYQSWKAESAELEFIRTSAADRLAEAEGLRVLLEEIERVAPLENEDTLLAERANRLTHLEELRIAATAAHEAISSEGFQDSPDATALLGLAKKHLEHAGEHDEELARLAKAAGELAIQLAELSGDVSAYLANLDVDGARELGAIQERRSVLTALVRKHGQSVADVLAFNEAAASRMLALDSSTEKIDALASSVAARFEAMERKALRLSELRAQAAANLSEQVNVELAALAMPGATLVVTVAPASEFAGHGKDQVTIALSSYPGAEPRPLGKGASGGEISRIMLAIEVVLAKTQPVPTFIFDEVDAGVGGAAAIEVGKRLAILARQAQVIVVTHLAQVAAFANQHLTVSKTTGQDFTASDVRMLSESERVSELARMLSGLSGSESALNHAAELIELAASF
ncbi:MAG: repair protein RecN [Actinomycetota bacterium]|jgi:DNA repair protein RecN (Recombination protein N)